MVFLVDSVVEQIEISTHRDLYTMPSRPGMAQNYPTIHLRYTNPAPTRESVPSICLS